MYRDLSDERESYDQPRVYACLHCLSSAQPERAAASRSSGAFLQVQRPSQTGTPGRPAGYGLDCITNYQIGSGLGSRRARLHSISRNSEVLCSFAHVSWPVICADVAAAPRSYKRHRGCQSEVPQAPLSFDPNNFWDLNNASLSSTTNHHVQLCYSQNTKGCRRSYLGRRAHC